MGFSITILSSRTQGGDIPNRNLVDADVAVVSKPNFQYTGIPRNIIWNEHSPPVPIQSETALRQSGILIRPGEFGRLTDERVDEIAATCRSLGMTLAQGLSVRKQVLVTEIAYTSSMLQKQSKKLSERLALGQDSILDLSAEIHQPPVSILRAILSSRIRNGIPGLNDRLVKTIVKAIVNGELASPHLDDFLSTKEQKQLDLAKTSDVMGYVEQYNMIEQEAATAWEGTLHRYLDKQNVSYLKEQDLQDMGCLCTPDCLLLDECTINGQPVRWIDCKNYYGSVQGKYFVQDLNKQIQRYDEYFGTATTTLSTTGGGERRGSCGAIVFRHGFSAAMPGRRSMQALLLDRGPLCDLEMTTS